MVKMRAKDELLDLIFSWTLEDISNENLYKDQAYKIPDSFDSMQQYLGAFTVPLLEEVRAELASALETVNRAPIADVITISEAKPYGTLLYDVEVDVWRNRRRDRGSVAYRTLPGDLVIICNLKPETASDLQRFGCFWFFASVTNISDDDEDGDFASTKFKLKASKDVQIDNEHWKSKYLVFLMNTITSKRIWNSLHIPTDGKILEKVLSTSNGVEESCEYCPIDCSTRLAENIGPTLLSKLNESQHNAILASLHGLHFDRKSPVELIWGPPGTGKTMTLSIMLFALLRMGIRTLVCAPTNVAVTEVASRVIKLVEDSYTSQDDKNILPCPLGEIILFGNKDRLKLDADIKEVFLDYRVDRLVECFGPLTGWRCCIASMIDFLENCISQHRIFVENELINLNKDSDQAVQNVETKSLLDFALERFIHTASNLRKSLTMFLTHLPKGYILEQNFLHIRKILSLLDSIEQNLFQYNLTSGELELFFDQGMMNSSDSSLDTSSLLYKRSQCISILRTLQCSLQNLELPSAMNRSSVVEFCYQTSSLIFCTSSSSYKLHSLDMLPLRLLIIDEAAQLKESEMIIPLQLLGLKHAILVGDEKQLPATVNSMVAHKAGFGRSLFERFSSLDHPKHLLSTQYRMHPSISCFPNSNFYFNQIQDGPNVKSRSYGRHYLPGRMFGPYSFINVLGGKEETDDTGQSRKNMVEVAVVMKIIEKIYKEWVKSQGKLSIGIISPYGAQVIAILDKVGRRFENLQSFEVKVKSIDGFQGGEEDVIILSTVRSNNIGSIGFVSNPQRTNVALTRARHSLWILGNERTLINSDSIWKKLIYDAKERNCFFNADEDEDISKTILDVKKELDQLDDLLNSESVPFRNAIWKVLFSDNFRKSFRKIVSSQIKKSVLMFLLKLAGGWRPKRNVDLVCESSSQIVKQFKVENHYVICTIDIVKASTYVQALKVWDILHLEEIPKLVKHLDTIFSMYTDDFINRCKEKCLEGVLQVPKSWTTSQTIIRLKNSNGSDSGSSVTDGKHYVENSKVSESLMLMKFYSFSSGIAKLLLSDHDGQEVALPFEVTDEEKDIIVFPRSSFILGRSGTGKTTILTMKLLRKLEQHHVALEGFGTGSSIRESNTSEVSHSEEETARNVLHQIFVTVSPTLCYAIKKHVSQLTKFACGRNYSADKSSSGDMVDVDEIAQFKDIPDTFLGIEPRNYPLVITFHKFIMMLDGTVGNSYFERFQDVWDFSQDKSKNLRSVALKTFMRSKEVNYDSFASFYWPHFNLKLTKDLDPSRVFTEIMSHIKGGLRAGEEYDASLSKGNYVLLSKARISTLGAQKREAIYDIFQDYEKMKRERGEFDLADLVLHLHHRLKNEGFEGDKMDFVYIDEVQDLTMSQIALFKYICKNVDEGFVFSGDTAQTIARGVDFRFQDIRSLFYNEFVMESKGYELSRRTDKGLISDIFNLSQNFRTHAGVLKLAQSVIDLLRHFFPQAIDVLTPETSRIYGEAPILFEPGSEENAIITIFGNGGNDVNMVGFGAEQVILVRDESSKREVSGDIGHQALILTIAECKGLEFQDVLLYNFFGSSPLRSQWRVIFDFLKENGLLDPSFSNPNFSSDRHNILCSELKQLYVAITRTKQRLWICENNIEFSKPMFDYWKKLGLVQVRNLDHSLAQEMQTPSSTEEWKSQGIKLFWEKNYDMARLCFERAGDATWEKRAQAAGLRANSERLRGVNPQESHVMLREAAKIFESIGKADSAAECFCDLEEYETAGRIYLERCGESGMRKAGECFTMAKCYELAAAVYAKGNFFAECLSVCSKGKLCEIGLQYIEYWKQKTLKDNAAPRIYKEIDKFVQDFLESCANNYYELKDNISMMKFVTDFQTIEMRRTFLRSRDCIDDLFRLEEASGHFIEAAEIAKMKCDVLLEADMLRKAEHFHGACLLVLQYVFVNSLWVSGGKGWPPKPFARKLELLIEAMLLAKKESETFYKYVCAEVDALLNEQNNMPKLMHTLRVSKKHGSVMGEILSVRKILDAHLSFNQKKYEWVDEFLFDLHKHSEEMVSKSQVSVGSLVYFWNLWKNYMLLIIESLERQDFSDSEGVNEFVSFYFGGRRQVMNHNVTYLILDRTAQWVKKIDKFIKRDRNSVSVDAQHFALAVQSYWQQELLSVGMKVLDVLEALYSTSTRSSLSMFCQSMCLLYIFDITKFFTDSKSLRCNADDTRKLQRFQRLSGTYFTVVFPLECQRSLARNMVLLRGTELSQNLLEEVMVRNISGKNRLTYGQIGRILVIWLGSGKPRDEICEKILKSFDKYSSWKSFVENIIVNADLNCKRKTHEQPTNPVNSLVRSDGSYNSFHRALLDTYKTDWRMHDYMSPNCFLYLVERLLIMAPHSPARFFFTTKSSFVEWLIYREPDEKPGSCLFTEKLSSLVTRRIFDFVFMVVQQFLYNRQDTIQWIANSKIDVNYYNPRLVLRLIVILILLNLNSGKYANELFVLLNGIEFQLPRQFSEALRQMPIVNINSVSQAFKSIGDQLVVLSSGRETMLKHSCREAIFLDLGVISSKKDIIETLFPVDIGRSNDDQQVSIVGELSGLDSEAGEQTQGCEDLHAFMTSSVVDITANMESLSDNLPLLWAFLQQTSDSLNSVETWTIVKLISFTSNASERKAQLERNVELLCDIVTLCTEKATDDKHQNTIGEANIVVEELKQVSTLLNIRDLDSKNWLKVGEILKNVLSRRPAVDTLLSIVILHENTCECSASTDARMNSQTNTIMKTT